MKFEKEYFVGIKDIGKDRYVTNAGFLGFLEEIASNHSHTVGYGVNDIENKKLKGLHQKMQDMREKARKRRE